MQYVRGRDFHFFSNTRSIQNMIFVGKKGYSILQLKLLDLVHNKSHELLILLSAIGGETTMFSRYSFLK